MSNYLQILGDLSGLENLGYFFMMFLGFFIILFIIGIISLIILLIANYKIFEKAGEEGWKVFIPFYGTYTMCKFIGVNPYWILITLIGALLTSVPLVGLVSTAASLYFSVLKNVSLAKSFGKETGFAIGLIFLPIIFYPILAFGKNKYIGANPMEDIIFNQFGANKSTNNTNPINNATVETPTSNMNTQQPATNQTQGTEMLDAQPKVEMQPVYCTNCGTPLNKDDLFCTNCGTKRV
ncbi:MAG: zinc ribbon domain-containing protein [Bacilli bacterium]|nr:zinc ribbon domain-containing protein [Bacilli bacterium]